MYVWSSSHFWHRAPKTLGISYNESIEHASFYVNTVTFRSILGWRLVARRTNHVMRGFELLILTLDLLGGERHCKMNQWPVANGLISYAYVLTPP